MKKEITITPVRVADLLVAEDERMPVYVHIIDHPNGRVLVDTGMTELHPAAADMDPRLTPLNKQGLDLAGIDIIVNNKRGQVFSPDVFRNFGIDPLQKKLLVVKSTQHFYAGYAPIAAEIIYMAAPGAISPLMKEIPFTRVDLNKYPWVDDPLA